MKLELKDIPAKLTALLESLKRYSVLIFIVAVCGIFGFLTFRINSLTQTEPTPEAVAEKLKTVGRPRIDQDAVDKLNQLQEENIEVKALFEQARDNPFSE